MGSKKQQTTAGTNSILAVQLDFGQKTVIIHPPFRPTGQMKQGMQQLQFYYQGAIGKHAEKF